MSTFEKIDFANYVGKEKAQPTETMTMSRRRSKRKFEILKSKKLGIALGIFLVIVVILVFAIVLPAKKLYSSVKVTEADAKLAASAMKMENIELASTYLGTTRTDLMQTQADLHKMSYLHFIPIASWYYSDGDHLVNAGFDGLDAVDTIVNAIKPNADLLGLKGKGSFVGGSAEQRISTAVATLGTVTPKIDDIAKSLEAAKVEIDAVDLGHYPTILGGGKINTQLTSAKKLLDEGSVFISDAQPLIKVLPSLLGEPDQKKYLVIFQNDKELRPTGGFITAYAVFDINKGVISVEQSSDIYELDATISNKPQAPTPILKYLPNVYVWNLRDTNLSPDFIVSMQEFKKLYALSSGPKVDGIIALDTSMLVSTMDILGDIQTEGTTFTTQTDARCECPQVIYALEQADQPVNYIKSNRKGLIGDLMYSILHKALSSSPKLYWGPLFQSAIAQIGQKHLLFDLNDPNAQQGLEALNTAGQIIPFNGDYLHVNDTNFASGKANLYVQEAVTQDYQLQSDGSINKTITIKYTNNHPPSDCSLASGGLCLNTTYRDWNRIYVPEGSQLLSSTGSEVKVTSYNDLGKTVFESFFSVRPLGEKTFTVSYKLPFKLKDKSDLPLLIQKQPGTNGNINAITINGSPFTAGVNNQNVQTFPLQTDQQIQVKF